MKDDKLYLINMLECIERIESYTSSGHEAFKSPTLIQDAVMRNFEILGEAAKRISPELRRSDPEIPWTSIAGLRDVLIHSYAAVDIDKVWNIVENDLSVLRAGLTRILNSL